MRRSSFDAGRIQPAGRTRIRCGGRLLDCFSGCDYFRLANHPAVLRAARAGVEEFGLSVAASRLTTGDRPIYRTLETKLARFFDAPEALLVPAGYLAPMVVAQAMQGTFSHALLDERAHPALLDAASFLECPVLTFRHRDAADLARVAAGCGRGARVVVLTDGMFGQDGSVAPLKAYLRVLPAGAWILVDDAHGAGVLGRTGKGTVEIEAVSRRRVIQCLTLSKAFGAGGGAVLCSAVFRKRMLARSRVMIGSTPMPPLLANAALASLKILTRDKTLRQRLVRNSEYVRAGLRRAGFRVSDGPGPIIAIELAGARAAAALKRRLLSAGIYPPFLKYPGGPASGWFRLAISSEHTRRQMDRLVGALASFWNSIS